MGKRKREDSMKPSKEEKHRLLNEKLKELERHQYWHYSSKLRALCLINRSPRKLMSSLQTKDSDEEEELLSSNACSVCSDCFEKEECDEEEVGSVVVSSASVQSDTCNENNDDRINKIYEEGRGAEINQGPGEMNIVSTSTNVKNAGKIRKEGWVFDVLIIVLVLIIGLVIAAMLSVHGTWSADDQDLDQEFLPPT
ncbi:hypothetical protein POM88_038839 [Heracleum sosnowskyi]|uniref:Uncharacterized protein n=1 Tax=Heracleum sosnowskyi TaxID=360622 RepID=A0AAD8HB79_9APIA|nr:hypothetical protein POM88_038839 [Heracleum sosnowskyi]